MLALPRVSFGLLTVHRFLELMEGTMMQASGRTARRAVQSLGKRAKTTRIPDDVRRVVLAHTREARSVGQSWRQIAETVGLSTSLLLRWKGAPAKKTRRPTRLKPVVLSSTFSPVTRSSLVWVTAQGDRLEGLCVEDAVRLIRDLR